MGVIGFTSLVIMLDLKDPEFCVSVLYIFSVLLEGMFTELTIMERKLPVFGFLIILFP